MDKISLMLSISVTIIIFILFLYVVICYEKKRRSKFIKNAVETEGIIESVILGYGIRTLSFRLNYYYYDQNKIKYNASKAIGIQAFAYKKGERISVYYDPSNPNENTILMKQKGK